MAKPFYSFMKQFKDDRSPIGDLARDMADDDFFPKTTVSAKKVREYISGYTNRLDGVDIALDEALELYKKYRSQ